MVTNTIGSSLSLVSSVSITHRSKVNETWMRRTLILTNRRSRFDRYRVSVTSVCAWRIDASKSTKGASKLRRDLINAEIANLRDLLPLPPSTRQRLSQLQLMALVCVFLRKANYFQQGKHDEIDLIKDRKTLSNLETDASRSSYRSGTFEIAKIFLPNSTYLSFSFAIGRLNVWNNV